MGEVIPLMRSKGDDNGKNSLRLHGCGGKLKRAHKLAEEHRAKTACFSYEPDVDGTEGVRYRFAVEDSKLFLDRIATY